MLRGLDRPTGKRAAGAVLAVGILVAGGQGGAGHSVGHFPSYYPDEIRIDAVDPATAGKGLVDETLHAYVGAVPIFAGPVPEHVKSVRSLGSFLVLSFNTKSAPFASADSRCAAARGILAALSEEKAAGFVFHPYPVTPYHADYLYHVDRVEAAKSAIGRASAPMASVKVGAKGRLASTIVRARWDSPPAGGRHARGGSRRRPTRGSRCAIRGLVRTAVGQGRLVPSASVAGAESRGCAAASGGREL